MAQKSGLGKGLDALIPNWQELAEVEDGKKVLQIPIEKISPNPHQPRKEFHEENLGDLAGSIREHGILQPLILTQGDLPDHYFLIAGERRLRAAKLAGLNEVPALVRTASEQEKLEFAVIENMQREDLNPLERARAYASLVDEFNLTHDEVAKRVGKSRTSVTNSLRLLNLPTAVQQALLQDSISEGHARALLALPNSRAMEAALETVLKLELSVRRTEALVNKLLQKSPAKPPHPGKSNEIIDLENRMRKWLNTRVTLQPGARGGSITIYYYSDEELNAITGKFGLDD